MKNDPPPCERDEGAAERVLSGLGVAPGLALGRAHVSDSAAPAVPEYPIAAEEVAAESARFEDAVQTSRRQLISLEERARVLHGPAGEEVGFILDAHLAMLTQSRLVRGVVNRIGRDLSNAEAAVAAEIDEIAATFAGLDDPYFAARADDVRAIGGRLLRNLTQTPFTALGNLPAGTILLAEELTPADTALLDPSRLAGFATMQGGAESHTAIMARALGIPAILGCAGLMNAVCSGDLVMLDGRAGTVTVNPSAETLAGYERRRAARAHEQQQLDLLRPLPSVTRDGIEITLEVNLELSRELDQALQVDAAGIGLVRTEFMFMNRAAPPSEDEQAGLLADLVRGMKGRPVTIRTLDVGGDKLAGSLPGINAESPNPALGLRAIRFGLKHRQILSTQIAAILRAGAEGPVRMLLPMISSLVEVRVVRGIVDEVFARLRADGVRVAREIPPIGIMIEVPGAALAADAFGSIADFFALGTNDLTQYTLAIDRGDEQVAHLYNPQHPAVLRLIQFSTEAALRAGIPVSVCGEMAGDPRYTSLLIGLGIRVLSMAPVNLPRIKQRVRSLTVSEARRLADRVMAERDEERIAELLEESSGPL
jgi:phosphotransferase system enzyme I (PtsI)